MLFNINSQLSSKAERLLFDEEEYLKIPAIILKEGVMHDIYYNSNIIRNNIYMWNGVVVCVGHPIKEDVPVSANSFEQDSNNIGKLFNSRAIDNKIYSDIYINIKKANKKGYEYLINSFLQFNPTDVSTGLYCDYEISTGIYNNKSYSKIAKNILPDHLAILLNEKGACSQLDGCGTLRNNCKCKNEVIEMTNKTDIITSLIANNYTQLDSSDTKKLEQLDNELLTKIIPIVQNNISDEQYKEYLDLKANKIEECDLEDFKEFKTHKAARLEDLRKQVKQKYNRVPELAINQMSIPVLEGFLNPYDNGKIFPILTHTDDKPYEFPKTFKRGVK